MSEPIRVLIADDHRLFREGVTSLLQRAEDVELVGEAADGDTAVALTHDLVPDVVLMDLQMPGTGGIEATRAITAALPHVGVIVVTMFEDDEWVFAALKAGASGYVLKDADRGMLLRAIRAVANGEVLIGAPVARRVLDEFSARAGHLDSPGRRSVHEPFDQLTPRELEVLQLIARGLRNRQIAEELVITEKTVGNHISNIFSKLHVADRVDAVIRAREAGLDRQ